MQDNTLNYEAFVDELAAQVAKTIPDFVGADDREYLISAERKFVTMSGEALCKGDTVCTAYDTVCFYLQLIGEYIYEKALGCIYCGIPAKHRDSLLQNIAFVLFELVKNYIENDISQSEIISDSNDVVDEIFSQNIDRLADENEIDEKTAAMVKVFKWSSLIVSDECIDEAYMYTQANFLMLEEEYNDALRCYDKLIKIAPKDVRYYEAKAICLHNLEQYEQAAEVYKQIISLNKNRRILFMVAENYYLAEDFSGALAYYSEYLNYIESEAEGCKEKCDYCTGMEDDCSDKSHIEYYEDFAKLIEKTYIMIANCYYSKGDYINAVKYYDYVLENDSNNFEAIFGKAECYRKQKCYNAALEKYFSLPETEINEVKIVILTNIAICYDEMKQHETALEYYEKVLELAPENSVAVFNKGACCYEQHKYDSAIKLMQESISLGYSDIIDAYRIIIYCLIERGDYQTAIEYCEKTLGIEPNNAEALLNRADCALHISDINTALLYAQKALDNNVENKNRAYSILGDCYTYEKDYEKACEYYNKVINEILSKNDFSDSFSVTDDLRQGLGYAYYAKGCSLIEFSNSYDEAFMCFMRAIDYGYDKEECELKIKDIKRNWG